MIVKFAKSKEELCSVLPILQQLRPDYELDALLQQILKQQEIGYEIAYVEGENSEVLCASGFTISLNLAWGKHMYIADFVSDESRRSKGAGQFLLNGLKAYAKEMGCGQIHLDSGVQRFAAHKFYLREGFHIASHHFTFKDLN